MSVILAALAPIFLIIALGRLARARRVLPDEFWAGADRLTYLVLFPCLVATELAKARLGDLHLLGMSLAMAAGILAGAGAMLAGRRWMTPRGEAPLSDASFTAVLQGAIRPNTYVGLAGAKALFGAPGLTLIAVGIAVVVPLVNVLCVAAMVRWGDHPGGTPVGSISGVARPSGAAALLRGLLGNPIIVAAALGAGLNLSGVGLPPIVGPVAEILARAALPLGLLSVGAGLDFAVARSSGRGVAAAGLAKLALVPAVTALAGTAMGVEGVTLAAAVLFNALPCSASAYALARQMGGDAPLVAGMITIQTILAAATIPLCLMVLAGM